MMLLKGVNLANFVQRKGKALDKGRPLCNTLQEVFGPIECLAIDTMGSLPLATDSKQYTMVERDYFTKWKEALALENHTAQTFVNKACIGINIPFRNHTDQDLGFK